MRTQGTVWPVVLCAALAGCAGTVFHETGDPVVLVSGTHAVLHEGGPLLLRHDGADPILLDLYSPADEPWASVLLDTAHPDAAPDLPPGSWVLRLRADEEPDAAEGLDARLLLPAGTRTEPLVEHVERHVVVERPRGPLPHLPGMPAEPLDTATDLTFARPPLGMRLVASGGYEDLTVVVRGTAGPVLEASAPGAPRFFERSYTVGSEFHGVNVRGRSFEVSVEAVHLDGVLLLESWSYSRAPAPLVPGGANGSAPVGDDAGRPVFLYGDIGERPQRFEVHPQANALHATSEEDATLVLWGPDGARAGAYLVPAGTEVRIPVSGGDHVAVAWGTVALAATRAPSDLDLHPLEVVTWGQDGFGDSDLTGLGASPPYVRHEVTLDGPGVLYRVVLHDGGGIWSGCDEGLLRVLQGGEVLASTRLGEDAAGARLVDGPAQVVAEGAGPCVSGGYMAYAYQPW